MHGQNNQPIKKKFKIKMRKLNKKGVVFAASAALFMTVLLLYAVTVYQIQEEGDSKVIISSLATRVIELADSVEHSVKKIYLVNNNMSINISPEIIDEYPDLYMDNVMINTSLVEYGQTSAKFESDLLDLENFVSATAYGVYFNSSAIIQDPTLYKGDGISILKTADNTLTGENQKLIIYYNKSGDNTARTPGINISINSFEDMRGIYSSSTPTAVLNSHFLNITINDMDYPTELINSEDTEESKKIIFDTLSDSESHTWLINNTGNTTSFLNITLDHEKVEITALEGNFNITAYLYVESERSSYDFYFEPYALEIIIPKYETQKISQIRFI